MDDHLRQADFDVRLDWGPVGARATQADVSVVVDVLSFSTAVTVAVERGTRVFPYQWRGPRAEEFAKEHDALLALGRLEEGRSVAIVAAGERWSEDASLRPALEDHLGAGAIVSSLVEMGHAARTSPEAREAAGLFDAGVARLDERMRDCVGSRELARMGFEADVAVAAALDASPVVPLLVDGAFGRAR